MEAALPLVMEMFYVLRPTQALREWLSQRDVPRWMKLDRPHVWSQVGFPGDHDYVGQEEDAQTFLKLAVLAHFQAELERAMQAPRTVMEDSDVATRRVLAELLGPTPLCVEVFDRWWTLESVEGLNRVESTLAHIPVPTLRRVHGPEKRSPRVEAQRASCAAIAINGGPRPVGEWWKDAIEEREGHAPCLQLAVGWILERLVEKTPHRTCALRLLPVSLDAPAEDVLQVPGWTLQGRAYALREGIKLTLEEHDRYDNAWSFTYRVYAGARTAVAKGRACVQLEKTLNGWKVCFGSLEP